MTMLIYQIFIEQSLYDIEDLKKPKVEVAQKKLNKINPKTKIVVS